MSIYIEFAEKSNILAGLAEIFVGKNISTLVFNWNVCCIRAPHCESERQFVNEEVLSDAPPLPSKKKISNLETRNFACRFYICSPPKNSRLVFFLVLMPAIWSFFLAFRKSLLDYSQCSKCASNSPLELQWLERLKGKYLKHPQPFIKLFPTSKKNDIEK